MIHWRKVAEIVLEGLVYSISIDKCLSLEDTSIVPSIAVGLFSIIIQIVGESPLLKNIRAFPYSSSVLRIS